MITIKLILLFWVNLLNIFTKLPKNQLEYKGYRDIFKVKKWSSGYKRLQTVTNGYKRLQTVTNGKFIA